MADPYSYSAELLHRSAIAEAERRAALRRLEPRRARAKRSERTARPVAPPAAVTPRRWHPFPLTARGIFA